MLPLHGFPEQRDRVVWGARWSAREQETRDLSLRTALTRDLSCWVLPLWAPCEAWIISRFNFLRTVSGSE